jgi:hypothetical protein
MPGASALVFAARCLGGIAGHTSAFSGSPCKLEAGRARENSKAALSRMEPNQSMSCVYLDCAFGRGERLEASKSRS